uniref:UBC core domain-containing protein n=1 Tax=Phaeomonas parva TaxID=124430 RepID=A0A7S1TYR4_9STRA|mmetsp:Transcript_21113/g.64304  ORF Transcript_21113/g.64304 Transcript_21113/m.64304 type:complete len:243 (+) Transcript_21113:182-910(+)|eukprot:CAMPEP_0118872398 /NCGR_PEP_ID=MMETSP1163-20130328/14595_1 /TAXON_ID=124430 /ORGANISM="Phaeomonas parva, Strain CCMP2877" /LENGTH=242 /DNA_ID=CAMNT_0006807577 /DNA_START=282 /DNA_END=1010 /DNA_ORIENTATION=+
MRALLLTLLLGLAAGVKPANPKARGLRLGLGLGDARGLGLAIRGGADDAPAPMLQGRSGFFGRLLKKITVTIKTWLFGGKRDEENKASRQLGKRVKRGNPLYRIQKELREFVDNPPPNCKVSVGDNIRVWTVTLTGAEDTLYEGEEYKLRVTFPTGYPTKPPSVYFLKPPPKHPHVYTNGDICLSLLGKDWRPNLTASSLALSILSMLSSAREKRLPNDNAQHADSPPGKPQDGWMYHDDSA